MPDISKDPRGTPATDRLNYTAYRLARALNRAAENTALAHGVTLPPLLILQVLGEGVPLSNAQVFGDRVHIWLDEADRDEALRIVQEGLARAGVTPAGLRIITPSLEDVFIAKLARASAAGATGQPS